MKAGSYRKSNVNGNKSAFAVFDTLNGCQKQAIYPCLVQAIWRDFCHLLSCTLSKTNRLSGSTRTTLQLGRPSVIIQSRIGVSALSVTVILD
jgi:hypothetical protein